MKCWKNACNLGKNSSSLTPSRNANTPLKLTNEISCICCAVCFLAKRKVTRKYNDVDLGVIDDVRFGVIRVGFVMSPSGPVYRAADVSGAGQHFAFEPTADMIVHDRQCQLLGSPE